MIIITGGAGFIGSALLSKLNADGVSDLLVVDNLGESEKWRNLLGKQYTDYVHKDEFISAIHRDSLPFSPDAIVHLGACSSTTEKNADYLISNNYLYSKTLARYALDKGIRFIYASSAAAYGDGSQGFSDSDENCSLLRPLNIYGYSKQLFDLWAIRTGAHAQIAGLRFFNVYGPNEYHKKEMASVVFKAYQQIKETNKLRLFKSHHENYKDGEQVRDFIYIKDCVEVISWLLNTPSVNGIFNLGTGTARTWNVLGESVFTALGENPNFEYFDIPKTIREGYQYYTQADIKKLRMAGWKQEFTSLEDGITDYVQNYLASKTLYF